MPDLDLNSIIQEPFFSKTTNRIRLFLLGCFFLVLISFNKEISGTFSYLWLSLLPGGRTKITPEINDSFEIVLISFFIFLFMFLIMLIAAAPCLLPAQTLGDGLRVVFHFIVHILGLHGQAIFIKDGKALANEEDLRKHGIGLAVVDYNSAVVLEEEIFAPTLENYLLDLLERFLAAVHLYTPFQRTRVCGKGIVFIRRLERIRSVVDLRRQTRSKLEICAYTNDGIEVSTIVWSLFSLGQDPRYKEYVQEIAYQGAPRPENLRLLTFARVNDHTARLFSISDSISAGDRSAIHQVIQESRSNPNLLEPYSHLPLHPLMPAFDEERVFKAVFSQARNEQEALLDWAATPLNLAIETFRNLILRYNFDQIFNPDGDAVYPLRNIQNELNNALVGNGLICYRLITRRGREGSQLWEEQREYPTNILLASNVLTLSPATPLRQRGIKVIASGFTDLIPVSALVYQQRVDNWRASLDSKTRVSQAQQSLQAMQIQSRERRKVQKALIEQFSRVLEADNHTEEAIAIGILQALEDLVSDPSTNKKLPGETISILNTIHGWLLPNEALPPRFPRLQ